MSTLRRQAMEAMLEAASQDVAETLKEQGIGDDRSEDVDDAVYDVAILYAYRVFTRICENGGLTVDAPLFAELAADLAEEIEDDSEGA
ncbi:MAG: hypothetical protein WCK65_02165 [Rhodospirillaceae bacterium]